MATGIVTATPSGSPIAPVIAVAGGGSSTTTAPPAVTTTTKAPAGGGGTTAPTAKPVTAPSGSLAFTGTGPGIGVLSVLGGALVLLGFALLVLVDAPRRAVAQLASLGLTKWRQAGEDEQRSGKLASLVPGNSRQLLHSGMRMAKQTAAWLLGR